MTRLRRLRVLRMLQVLRQLRRLQWPWWCAVDVLRWMSWVSRMRANDGMTRRGMMNGRTTHWWRAVKHMALRGVMGVVRRCIDHARIREILILWVVSIVSMLIRWWAIGRSGRRVVNRDVDRLLVRPRALVGR